MSLTRYRGLLVIALWQAPVGPVVEPDGSIGFMFGSGHDSMTDPVTCGGPPPVTRPVPYSAAALEADFDLGERGRLDAAAGLMFSDTATHDGFFGALALRFDFTQFGIGGGVAIKPPYEETRLLPSVHLRAGSAERLHLRVDVHDPSGIVGIETARVGLGYNDRDRHRPGGVIAYSAIGADDLGAASLELTLPFSSTAAFRLHAHYGPGEENAVYGAMIGLRLLLR
jgi:hypothetical protein